MKVKRGFGERIVSGPFFEGLKNKALEYLRNPDKLRELIRSATNKAKSAGRHKALAEVWDSLMIFLRLLRAVAKQEYTGVSWQSLVMIVAAVLYLLAPVDLIPDFLVGIGYVDDAAVLAFVIRSLKAEVEAFLGWERSRASGNSPLC
jgi:uncharacterized membrane protein YkvA (DUF1232 family)